MNTMRSHRLTTVLTILTLLAVALPGSGQTRLNPRSTTSIVVAAADAPFEQRLLADYICDGVADEVQVNAAIARANLGTGNFDLYRWQTASQTTGKNSGGHVELSSGSFILAAKIDAKGVDELTIGGQGMSTVISVGQTDGTHGIEAINATATDSQHRLQLTDFIIQGNASSSDNIHLDNIEQIRLHNVHSYNAGDDGAEIRGASSNQGVGNQMIQECQFAWNGDDGLVLEAVHETIIGDCHIEENADDGIYLIETTDTIIGDCSIEDNVGDQIDMTGTTARTSLTGVFSAEIANCDIPGVVRVLMNDNGALLISNCSIATLTSTGNTTDARARVYISSTRINTDLSGTYDRFTFNGGQVNIASAVTFGEFAKFDGCRLTAGTTATITPTERFSLANVTMDVGTTSLTIDINDTDGQFVMDGCDFGDTGPTSGVRSLIVDASGAGNTVEITITGNTFELSDLTVIDGQPTITGNTFIGAAGVKNDLLVQQVERPLVISSNTFRLMDVEVDNTNTVNCHLVYGLNSHDSNTAATVDLQALGNGIVGKNVYDANYTVSVAAGLTSADNVGP